jgi:hypothetical protein
MKLVHASQDSLLIDHLRHVLESEGLAPKVRNETLRMAAGDIPPTECWLELWVEDSGAERASAVVAEALTEPASPEPEWTCASCAETSEGQFGECWSCGTPRPDPSA